MNKYSWLSTATRLIRFAPDQRSVLRELEAHIQDREDAYRAKGLDGYAAECAAVADMGDPEEVAQELGRLHSPWWGRLWRLSRVVMWCVAVWAGIALAGFLIDNGDRFFYAPALPEAHYTYEYNDYRREIDVPETWEPRGSVPLSGYRFSAPMAWVEHWTPYTFEDGSVSERYQLVVYLRADTWRFWEPCSTSQSMVLDHVATDSEGNCYSYNYEAVQEGHRSLFCNTYSSLPATTWYEVQLELPGPEAPDWVEIPVGYGGDSLRVDLTGERVS